MMSAQPDPVLFEAVCTPPRSLGRRGAAVLALLVLAGSSGVGALCLALGAWPVLGFVGLELGLVLCLMLAHRRWSRRATETLLLAGGRLVVRRTDARGERREWVFDAYWTRLVLEERAGGCCAMLLRGRGGTALEIGGLLGEEQKRDLAEALRLALRRYREPVFDNPQLREGGPVPPPVAAIRWGSGS